MEIFFNTMAVSFAVLIALNLWGAFGFVVCLIIDMEYEEGPVISALLWPIVFVVAVDWHIRKWVKLWRA